MTTDAPKSDGADTVQDNDALWDQIEAKYWESIRLYRDEEDTRLDAPFVEQNKSLGAQHLDAVEEQRQLLAQYEAIRRQMELKDQHISEIQQRILELNHSFKNERDARNKTRAREDANRRNWFANARIETAERGLQKESQPPTSSEQPPSDDANPDADEPMADALPSPPAPAQDEAPSPPPPAQDPSPAQTPPVADSSVERPSRGASAVPPADQPLEPPAQPSAVQSPAQIDDTRANLAPPQASDSRPSTSHSSGLSTPLSEPPPQLDEANPRLMDAQTPTNPSTGITVQNGFHETIDHLRRIDLDTHWAKEISQLPIQRPICLRLGKDFTGEIKQSIYRPTDIKGARWLSCEIQATGDIQDEAPCEKCQKGTGPFQGCVSLGTETFPRCGNCEWNKQSCSLQRPGLVAVVPVISGFTAVNKPREVESKPATPVVSRGGSAAPAGPSRSGSTAPAERAHTTPAEPAPSGDITKATLILRDDGVVFTDPPCMRGVPLEKISSDHPYWDPDWQKIEDVVTPTLNKYNKQVEKHESGEVPFSSFPARMHANRQINRGNDVMEFLKKGDFHPYQIMGREWVGDGKGVAGYDTVYRLVKTHKELAKFKINVTPTQWLRQRLCEIYEEMGEEFQLGKTIHDLYHDPKVVALRQKSGFKNIGRPSGLLNKRKEPPSADPTPSKTTERPNKISRRSSTTIETPNKIARGSSTTVDTPPTKIEMPTKIVERHSKPIERPPKTVESPTKPVERPSRISGTSSDQIGTPSKITGTPSKVTEKPSSKTATPSTKTATQSKPTSTPSKRTSTPSKPPTPPPQPYSPSKANTPKKPAPPSSSSSSSKAKPPPPTPSPPKPAAPAAPPASKKTDPPSSPRPPSPADLEYDGYTTSDSFSHDIVTTSDWRISRIKHRTLRTSRMVTQYWHFIEGDEDEEGEDLLEHQVLRDVLPARGRRGGSAQVKWGLYKDPIDFHLRLKEVDNVRFTRGGPWGRVVVVGMKEGGRDAERGDLCVEFKRERTKRRWLEWMRDRGVRVGRVGGEEIRGVWEGMGNSGRIEGEEGESEDE